MSTQTPTPVAATATPATLKTQISNNNLFITTSLTSLLGLKETKSNKGLQAARDSLNSLIEASKSEINQRSIDDLLNLLETFLVSDKGFKPTLAQQTTALDILSKLLQYNFIQNSAALNRTIDLITNSYSSASTYNSDDSDKLLLQIFKALQAAVLTNGTNATAPHGESLLKIVRNAYNIYLLQPNAKEKKLNQQVAKSILQQIINCIFERIKIPEEFKGDYNSFRNGSGQGDTLKKSSSGAAIKSPEVEEQPPPPPPKDEEHARIIASSIIETVLNVVTDDEKTNVESPRSPVTTTNTTLGTPSLSASHDQLQKVYLWDGFVVFRALCRLSMKPLPDIDGLKKDPLALKSKILSLELLAMIVREHFDVVSSKCQLEGVQLINGSAEDAADKDATSSTTFVQAVKQYLLASLSRNVLSIVPEVLDRSLDIFVRLVNGMRHLLKKEIEIFFTDIFFPILEKGGISAPAENPLTTPSFNPPFTTYTGNTQLFMNSLLYNQKLSILKALSSIISNPDALVEIFLNYDCDTKAVDNLYEHLVNILSKILTGSISHSVPGNTANQNQITSFKLLQTAPPLPPAVESLFNDLNVGLFSYNFHTQTQVVQNVYLSPGAGSGTSVVSSISNFTEHRRSMSKAASGLQKDSGQDNVVMLGSILPPIPFVPALVSLGMLNNLEKDKDQSVKFRALECLVTILQALVLYRHGYAPSSSIGQTGRKKSVSLHPEDPSTPSGSGPSQNAEDKSPAYSDDLSMFESMKHMKQATREGIQLFNWKIKKGIQHLQKHKIIDKSPQSLAKFLLYTPQLNKKNIGEYLGEGDEFNIQVMHHFVDLMNFRELDFVDALRKFLQAFRLPGEAQKIDRFMLKFAERYLTDNPGSFVNAETAYVLSYSTIMLNTDLHNPQVKRRMTKDDFIKNNRGISDGKDLPRDFLEKIYDEININEIKLKEEEALSAANSKKGVSVLANISAVKKNNPTNDGNAVESVYTKISNASPSNTVVTFHLARHKEHVRTMFQLVWMAILAGVSSCLQEAFDGDHMTSQLCLTGFKCCIHLCCSFEEDDQLETGRNAFISTLTKQYSLLNNVNDFIHKVKQVECVKAVFEVGYVDGNGLGDSWLDVLRSVSSIEKLVNSSNSSNDGSFSPAESPSTSQVDMNPNSPDAILLKQISQNLLIAMDRIFTSSAKLKGTAIVDFVKSLTVVSMEEIQQSTSSSPLNAVPRTYSLTKLVEISYYNMNNRIRVEWLNIWSILGVHFNEVGCHSNQHVAFFSVDSLRQLSFKFLEKEELSNFKFQKDFLKPFDYILLNNPSYVIKDMVLRCVHQLIMAKNENIKSGWKTLFSILNRAAKDPNDAIVTMSFDTIKALHTNENFLGQIYLLISTSPSGQAGGSSATFSFFPDYVACLVEFARNKLSARISLQAVEIVRVTVDKLSVKINSAPSKISETNAAKEIEAEEISEVPLKNSDSLDSSLSELADYQNIPDGSSQKTPIGDPIMKFWFPVCFGLYEIVMTCDLEVRTKALKLLFNLLKTHGETFTKEFWDVLARGVLFPLFDDLKLTRSEKRKFENKEDMMVWLNTTLIEALRQLFDLFTYMFSVLEGLLLDGLLDLIKVCFNNQQENDTLAKIGSNCLLVLIQKNIDKLQDSHWKKLCKTIEEIFENTTPSILFEPDFINEVYRKASGSSAANLSPTSSPIAEEFDNAIELENATHPSNEDDAGSTSGSVAASLNRRNLKKDFQGIIIKCVLHLIIVHTVSDLLTPQNPSGSNVGYTKNISFKHLSKLLRAMKNSFLFAKKFNGNKQLRLSLYKVKFMKHLPNLLRQETSAGYCLLKSYFQVYNDPNYVLSDEDNAFLERDIIESSLDIVERFSLLEQPLRAQISLGATTTNQQIQGNKTVIYWTPVIVEILNGYSRFKDSKKLKNDAGQLYSLVLDVVKNHDLVGNDIRLAIFNFLKRFDVEYGISRSKE